MKINQGLTHTDAFANHLLLDSIVRQVKCTSHRKIEYFTLALPRRFLVLVLVPHSEKQITVWAYLNML